MTTAKAAEPKADKPRVCLMFVGVSETDSGALAERFRAVKKTGDGGWEYAERDERLYTKLHVSTPGGIVSVEFNPGCPTSVYPSSWKWEGQWPVEDDRVKWMAQWRAEVNAHKEAKAAKEAMKHDAAAERLEPFRDAYRKLNAEGKRQMLAEVIRAITR